MVIAIPVEAVKVLYCKAVPVISEERKAFTYEMVDLPVPPPATLKIPAVEPVILYAFQLTPSHRQDLPLDV